MLSPNVVRPVPCSRLFRVVAYPTHLLKLALPIWRNHIALRPSDSMDLEPGASLYEGNGANRNRPPYRREFGSRESRVTRQSTRLRLRRTVLASRHGREVA